jgi:hypothetical protein
MRPPDSKPPKKGLVQHAFGSRSGGTAAHGRCVYRSSVIV